MLRKSFILSCLLLVAVPLTAQPSTAEPNVSPPRGALVIAGGAVEDPAIYQRFLDRAGGADKPIVIIPTAGGGESYDQTWPGLSRWRQAGATRLTVLHTKDRSVANDLEFVAPLREARGVWFSGGRQWRLADSYLGTLVHRELWGLLDRGGVIGGSSAGATIQGSYLARGDTQTNTIMMGDHEEGLAFLKNVAIDQHLLARNRQFDLLEIVQARPELLGIGLDEDTAIVVEDGRFEVIGQSYVAIYDADSQIDSGGSFYFLAPGDHYDLVNRQPYRPSRRFEPLERVVKRGSVAAEP
nr:cyanophycinase-like [Nerophis lumbriciformis]